VVGPVGRRSILSNHSDVILLLHLTVERCHCTNQSSLSIDAELVKVRSDLFDTVSYLPPSTILYTAPTKMTGKVQAVLLPNPALFESGTYDHVIKYVVQLILAQIFFRLIGVVHGTQDISATTGGSDFPKIWTDPPTFYVAF